MKQFRLPLICSALMSQVLSAQVQTEPKPEQEKTEVQATEASKPAEKEKSAATDKTKKSAERIQVTGSRIKRIDVEGPKPITVIGAEEIAKSGATTVNDLLNRQTFASFGSAQYGSGYGGVAELQSVSIHGLGSSNTLVLVNGRRIAKDPYLEMSDLSVIPVSAVERIEVLKGTASAVYGSDALGGVVNIITKKDVDGFSFGGRYTKPREKGGEESKAYYAFGTSSEKSRSFTVLEYSEKKPIFMDQRSWNDYNRTSAYGAPSSYLLKNGKLAVFGPAGNCPTEVGGNCRYPFLRGELSLAPAVNKLSIFNDYTYELTSKDSISTRLFANQYDSKDKGNPTVLAIDDDKHLFFVNADAAKAAQARGDVSADAAIDDAEGLLVRGRLVEGGRTQSLTKNQTLSGSASWKHQFDNGGEVEASVSESRIDRRALRKDQYNEQRLKDIIFEAKDFDITKTSDRGSVDKAKLDAPYLSRSYVRTFDLVYSDGSNDTFGYSFGVSRVNEGYSQQIPTPVAEGQVKDLGGADGYGKRHLNAVFGEINYKPVTELEVSAAARFDDYSDFGNSANPLLSMIYRPTSSFLVRTQAGTGFKAPSLRNVYDSTGRFFSSVPDYKKCAEAEASGIEEDKTRYCGGDIGVETESSGNKDLKAEKSVHWGLGFAFEPVTGTGLSVDYWNSKIVDQIDNAAADDIMQLENQGKDLPQGVQVIRGPSVDGKIGDVIKIVNPATNLSEARLSGIDTKAYTALKTDFGKFGVNSDYSYVLSNKYKPLPTSSYSEKIDESPRWRWNNTFSYSLGNVDFSMENQYIGKHRKAIPSKGYIGSYNLWNSSLVFNHAYNGSVTVGGLNVFAQRYPLDDSASYDRAINGTLYSVQGPSWYVGFDQKI